MVVKWYRSSLNRLLQQIQLFKLFLFWMNQKLKWLFCNFCPYCIHSLWIQDLLFEFGNSVHISTFHLQKCSIPSQMAVKMSHGRSLISINDHQPNKKKKKILMLFAPTKFTLKSFKSSSKDNLPLSNSVKEKLRFIHGRKMRIRIPNS